MIHDIASHDLSQLDLDSSEQHVHSTYLHYAWTTKQHGSHIL